MYALGYVLTWLLLLGLLGLPVALLALWARLLWQRVQRGRQRPSSSGPYDRAYERTLWELAAQRGEQDARRAVAELGGGL